MKTERHGLTVHEVSQRSGVSIRTLQYYDKIGLLKPAEYTDAGYRLYHDAQLERLQQILLFRELEFPLKDIQKILDAPDFDREKALDQQITLLELQKEHLEKLLRFARERKGEFAMSFDAFDTSKMEDYTRQAKEAWGQTEAYREFEEKNAGRTAEDQQKLAGGMMAIFEEFGARKDTADPAGAEAQALVCKLQDYITGHFYTCTDEILAGLGQLYAAGGAMTDNIDKAGGPGTAAFASAAISAYCS